MSTSILHLFFFTCFLLLKMHYLDHILECPIGPSLKIVQLRRLFDWTNMAAALLHFSALPAIHVLRSVVMLCNCIMTETFFNTLWKWNVIMYANVTVSLTLVSNKLKVPFFSVLFQWQKLSRALWKLKCRKREQKFRRKMPGCFVVECKHHSMRNLCQIFRFPTADSQLKR